MLIFDLTVVPTSYIQYMSYFIIFSSFTRIPGMFGVMGLVLNAEQRFDVSITWSTILGTVINSFIVYGFVYLCRFIFAGLPQYGEAYGAAMGLFLGGYLAGWLDNFVYFWILRKLGFSVKELFRIDFEKVNVKETFAFGTKLTIGSSWMSIAGIIESHFNFDFCF